MALRGPSESYSGLLGSETPKGKLSLRFPADTLDALFPRLFPQT
jgi:hypothetical protein